MKFFKLKFFILLFSIFISVIILTIFEPILNADTLIFPYSLHPFDIAKNYPQIWYNTKVIFRINLFISDFLILNSISTFLKFNKHLKVKKKNKVISVENISSFNLLIGINSDTQEKIFIPEKGLYQNILVTGTIGSRKDKFCNVSFTKAIDGMLKS